MTRRTRWAVCFLALCPALACAQTVTIIKIRMLIAEQRYEWSDADHIPERAADGFTSPSTVASFLGMRPGDTMAEVELERRRAAAAARLSDSGFFYSAQVAVAPASSREDGRLVVVRVTEGFTWRFGAGDLYAEVGKVEAFGERKAWAATAGANNISFSWEDDAVGGGPFLYSAGISYTNDLGSSFLDYHLAAADLLAGVHVTPDFCLTLASPLRYRWVLADASPVVALFPATTSGFEWIPAVRLLWQARGVPGLSAQADGYAGLSVRGLDALSFVSEARGSASVSFVVQAAVQLSAGTVNALSGGLPAYVLFDLFEEPDRSVRSGYARQDLLSAGFCMANIELRAPLPGLFLAGMFPVSACPFAFTDLALSRSEAGTTRDLEALGVGVRILFDNPVFAYFTATYGWNLLGQGRLCFTATRGF